MKYYKFLKRYILVSVLAVSLVLSSISPSFAVDQGWGAQHLMLGLNDDPITGGDGEYYVMSNLPAMQYAGIPVYDTSLDFNQFREAILTNTSDTLEDFPRSSGGRGVLSDMQNYTFHGTTANFLVRYSDNGMNAFFEASQELEAAPSRIGSSIYNLATTWQNFILGTASSSDLASAVTSLYNAGVNGLSAIGRFIVSHVNSSYGLLTSSSVTPIKTHAVNRDWYWAFTPFRGAGASHSADPLNAYFSGYYLDNGTLVEGVRYYLKAVTGNNLDKEGVAGGVSSERDYYVDVPDSTTDIDDTEVYAVYEGDTTNFEYIDYHDNEIYDVAEGGFLNTGTLWYSPNDYEYTYVTENYYITVQNYYTYNYVNYYMPGSDIPFSTYAVYYQLPDGRNSATLTADDIYGMNLDFDVIPYDIASEDTRMMALYHLDGTFDNDAITYSYQGGSVDQWQFDFSYLDGDIWPFPDPYTFDSYYKVFSGNFPAGVYHFQGEVTHSVSAQYFRISFYYDGEYHEQRIYGSPFSVDIVVPSPSISFAVYGRNSTDRVTFSNTTLTASIFPNFTTGSAIQSSLSWVYTDSAETLTGISWSAPYSGYYRFSYKSSATAANIGLQRFYANALWELNGDIFMGAILDSMPRGISSSDYGNYIAGDFTSNLNSNLQVHTFSVYLDAGDSLEFSAAFNPGDGNLSFTIQDVYIYGYGEENSNSTLGDYSTFEFTNGASTQFVTTGDENFAGSLYLDGLGHDFKISLPENPNASYGDWTVSFRYYQEQSTSNAVHYVSFGSNGYAYNTTFATLVFDGEKFQYLGFDGYYSSAANYGSGSNVIIPYGTWNTITICRSGGQLLFYLNGIQVMNVMQGNASLTPDGNIYFHFAADSNVHYIDEIMVASYAMYTANHTPRLIPWDSNSVYVLPYAVNQNSIAVKTPYAISGYRIGGVRPTFPDTGMVYAYVDDNYIVSIQVYNGSLWLDCGGSVYFNGHWYNIENFRFGTVSEQFDADPSIPSTGTDDISNSTNIFDFLNALVNGIRDIVGTVGELLEKFIDTTGSIVSEAIQSAASLIASLAGFVVGGLSNLVNGFVGLLGAITGHIGSWFSLTAPIGGFLGSFYNAIPTPVQGFLVGGFAVVMVGAVIHFLNK